MHNSFNTTPSVLAGTGTDRHVLRTPRVVSGVEQHVSDINIKLRDAPPLGGEHPLLFLNHVLC